MGTESVVKDLEGFGVKVGVTLEDGSQNVQLTTPDKRLVLNVLLSKDEGVRIMIYESGRPGMLPKKMEFVESLAMLKINCQ